MRREGGEGKRKERGEGGEEGEERKEREERRAGKREERCDERNSVLCSVSIWKRTRFSDLETETVNPNPFKNDMG